MERRLRLISDLFCQLTARGTLAVWAPAERGLRPLEPSEFEILRQFGEPRSPAEAADVAGYDFDENFQKLIERFVQQGLLVPAVADADPPAQATAGPPRPAATDGARERISRLVDPGSFLEDGAAVGGPVTGTATIDGRMVALVAYHPEPRTDPAPAPLAIQKVLRLQARARRQGWALVYLFDTFINVTGSREAPEEFLGTRSWGRIYRRMARLSGQVPQLGVVFGAVTMTQAFPPAMCDALVLVEPTASLSIASPAAVRQHIGEVSEPGALGGALMHCTVSGVGDARVRSEEEAFGWLRRYLAFMPRGRGGRVEPGAALAPDATGRALHELVPEDSERPFSMSAVIREIVDSGSMLDIKELYAREVITGFARIEGRPVGLVANNSAHRGGVMFGATCDKAARFIALCEAYGVPLVFLMDVPGFMIGTRAEQDGILRHASRLFSVLADATVPRLTVVVRKAHTAGLYAMCGPAFEPSAFLALPTAHIAVWGEKAAIAQAERFTQTIPDPTEAARFREQVRSAHRESSSARGLAGRIPLEVIESLPVLRAQLAVRLARATSVRRASHRKRTRLSLL